MLIAVLAVLVSFSTLFVYIYQSNLMKQQQKMSVWPYLTHGLSWGGDYLTINLLNKGIGPALVKSVSIRDGDNELEGMQNIMDLVPDTLQTGFNYSSIYPGLVLMAGEELRVFHVTDTDVSRYLLNLITDNRLTLEICYESVYGDSWITYGQSVEEIEC